MEREPTYQDLRDAYGFLHHLVRETSERFAEERSMRNLEVDDMAFDTLVSLLIINETLDAAKLDGADPDLFLQEMMQTSHHKGQTLTDFVNKFARNVYESHTPE